MTPTPAIRTTVVGSYPVPDWLAALPSEQALIDATRVVFKTQEMAGIDVVADGELYRFDVNHPDTNGMIDYFVRPLAGVRGTPGRREIDEFRRLPGMGFRSAPAGIVDGPLDEGTLNLPRDYRRARSLTRHPLKFTLTGPHMLSKTLLDHHYRDRPALAMALADVLARQVSDLDPQVIQVDEATSRATPAKVTGPPTPSTAFSMPRRRPANEASTSASATTAASRSRRDTGNNCCPS